ncbi:MAG: hypothetical protein QW343_00075 [Candidatus Norongarragalinales archaeon]
MVFVEKLAEKKEGAEMVLTPVIEGARKILGKAGIKVSQVEVVEKHPS